MAAGEKRETQIHPGIRIDKIPVAGAAGLIFAASAMAIFLIGLPEVRWFFALTLPAGVVVGLILRLVRRD
jgi:hypothetical protein